MTLPDIPRLYTALAEVLAVLVYAQAAPPRAAKPVTYAATAGWAAVLGVFLQLTGSVPPVSYTHLTLPTKRIV